MIQKYPSQCSGDWENGANGYSKDSNYADVTVVGESKSEEYYGFGFDFAETDEVEAVFIELTFWWQISLSPLWTDDQLDIAFAWNTTSGYVTFETVSNVLVVPSASGESSASRIDHLEDESFRITASDHNVTVSELNSASVKITATDLYYYSYVMLDVVSVIVAYTAPSASEGASAGPGTPRQQPKNMWEGIGSALANLPANIYSGLTQVSDSILSLLRIRQNQVILAFLSILALGAAILLADNRKKVKH